MLRCIVIGAGVAGLTTAFALAGRKLKVTLVDAATPGAASAVAGGLLAPLHPWRLAAPVNALIASSNEKYDGLFRACRVAAPRIGALYLDADDEFGAAQTWCEQNKRELARVGPDALRKHGVCAQDGFLLPDVRHTDASTLVAELAHALRTVAQFVRRRVVTVAQYGVQLDGGETLSGDAVVVCAGAWTARLVPGTTVRPVRGQMLELSGLPQPLRHAVLADGRYLVPQRAGACLVGSTVEDAGFDAATTADAAAQLLAFAHHRLPATTSCRVEAHRAGLRPGAERPVIGAHPELPGVFINSGHFRNGFAVAPAAAELTAEIVCGETPHLDPAPFAPGP